MLRYSRTDIQGLWQEDFISFCTRFCGIDKSGEVGTLQMALQLPKWSYSNTTLVIYVLQVHSYISWVSGPSMAHCLAQGFNPIILVEYENGEYGWRVICPIKPWAGWGWMRLAWLLSLKEPHSSCVHLLIKAAVSAFAQAGLFEADWLLCGLVEPTSPNNH